MSETKLIYSIQFFFFFAPVDGDDIDFFFGNFEKDKVGNEEEIIFL